jgi:cell wall-associated NlpC family hydrolase
LINFPYVHNDRDKNLHIVGKNFKSLDCSELVARAFKAVGLDLQAYTDSLYQYCRENGKVFSKNTTLNVGDMIFLRYSHNIHNELDLNGTKGPYFDHVMLVVGKNKDGSVQVIQAHHGPTEEEPEGSPSSEDAINFKTNTWYGPNMAAVGRLF